MASTGGRSESIAVALADQAFGALATQLQFSKQDLENIFATVASACKTTGERWLYMQTVKSLGANPFKKDVYAVKTRKKENGQWVDAVDFRVSYHFINGVARVAGYVIVSSQHWSADTWGGWDHVAGQPVQHIQVAGKSRGVLLGAWARAVPTKGGPAIGAYLPLEELVPPIMFDDKRKATVFESIVNGAYGPFWQRMPGRQCEKCVVAHVGRRVCPDLGAAYLAEEFGDVIDVEAIATPTRAPDRPALSEAPIDVDTEIKPEEPTKAAVEPATTPPAASDTAGEPTTDQLILAALKAVKDACGTEKTQAALSHAKDAGLRGKALLEYLEDVIRNTAPQATTP